MESPPESRFPVIIVDAVGLPFHIADVLNAAVYRFKFPDHRLSSIVDRACQALSIDDPRRTFEPRVWDERGESNRERISQVWFAGVHSNVGGGYEKQGMSLVALDWMLTQAERAGEPFGQHGLRVNLSERQYFREHVSVDDKLYDPRAGFGIFYRWKIRDIEAFCGDHGVQPKVHQTALERIAHGTDDYAPGNLPADSNVVITRPQNAEDAILAQRRAENLQNKLRAMPKGTLLSKVRLSMAVGQLSYYVYLLSCIAVVLAASRLSPESLRTHPWLAITTAGKLMWALLTSPITTSVQIGAQLIQSPRLLMSLVAGFAASYLMMKFADRRMGALFSGVWYSKQTELRDALKQARQEAQRR